MWNLLAKVVKVNSIQFRVVQVKSKVKVAISAIFLQGSELAQNNLNISKANLLICDLCYHQNWDFLDHGSIDLNNLDQRGMHLFIGHLDSIKACQLHL